MKLNFILKESDGEIITNKIVDSNYSPKDDDIFDFSEHLNNEDIEKSITTYQISKIIYRLVGDNIEVNITLYPIDINYADRLLSI